MNSVFATKMKCAVVSTLMSLAFVSQASGLLRPLFPIKPTAPSNGELIVIEDDLVLRSAKKLPMRFHRHRSARRLQQRPAFFALERCVGGAIGELPSLHGQASHRQTDINTVTRRTRSSTTLILRRRNEILMRKRSTNSSRSVPRCEQRLIRYPV